MADSKGTLTIHADTTGPGHPAPNDQRLACGGRTLPGAVKVPAGRGRGAGRVIPDQDAADAMERPTRSG